MVRAQINTLIKATRKLSSFACFLFAIMMLSGCAKYKVQRIRQQEKTTCLYEAHKAEADIRIQAFDQEAFKHYLTDYQPLHVHIKNKTDQPMTLAAQDISLPIASDTTITKKEPKLFIVNFLPCVLTSALGLLFWWELVLPSMLVLGAGGWQLSIKQHERTQKYVKKNMLNPQQTISIQPFAEVDTLIFVKREHYSPRFTLTVTRPTQQRITFNVLITARTKNVYHVS